MGAANDFRTDFAKSKMLHFSFPDQVGDDSCDFFNRNFRIKPVLIKEIDGFRAEAF